MSWLPCQCRSRQFRSTNASCWINCSQSILDSVRAASLKSCSPLSMSCDEVWSTRLCSRTFALLIVLPVVRQLETEAHGGRVSLQPGLWRCCVCTFLRYWCSDQLQRLTCAGLSSWTVRTCRNNFSSVLWSSSHDASLVASGVKGSKPADPGAACSPLDHNVGEVWRRKIASAFLEGFNKSYALYDGVLVSTMYSVSLVDSLSICLGDQTRATEGVLNERVPSLISCH
jgi:hypothetical protein